MGRARRRAKIELIYDILKGCKDEPKCVTNIIYGSSYYYPSLKKIVKGLIDVGLIEPSIIDMKACFQATEKGRCFLTQYDKLAVLVKDVV